MNAIFLTTFWEVMLWIFWVSVWMMVIWIFIALFADIFRRRDHSGLAKAGWTLLIFALPFIGALVYLIARPKDATAEQDAELLAAQRRAAGYSTVAEIEKAQQLLAAGTITQAEFEQIKANALV
jgi:Short C-terminal domain/Phospholipase_D-nuclease N-terminal